MGIAGFSHIGLCVSDLEVSSRFYEEVLGFRPLYSLDFTNDEVAATMEQPGAFTSRMLVRDDVRIELLWWQNLEPEGERTRRPMTRLGFTHLSFRVDRIDDLFEAVVRCGGAVWPETMSVLGDPAGPGEPVRLCYLTDPDGTRIEVMSGTPDLS
jgi:glyoxylase I family protein